METLILKKINKMKKVELQFEWNWKAQMHSIIRLLEAGDGEGKKYAREELLNLAEKLDKYNETNQLEIQK